MGKVKYAPEVELWQQTFGAILQSYSDFAIIKSREARELQQQQQLLERVANVLANSCSPHAQSYFVKLFITHMFPKDAAISGVHSTRQFSPALLSQAPSG